MSNWDYHSEFHAQHKHIYYNSKFFSEHHIFSSLFVLVHCVIITVCFSMMDESDKSFKQTVMSLKRNEKSMECKKNAVGGCTNP